MPQFWKGDGRNGYRVRCAVKHNGGSEPRECDLVFLDERPFAVFEWSEAGAAIVTVELAAGKLRAADPSGRVYDYSEVLIDPR